jgi:hypothetical protein
MAFSIFLFIFFLILISDSFSSLLFFFSICIFFFSLHFPFVFIFICFSILISTFILSSVSFPVRFHLLLSFYFRWFICAHYRCSSFLLLPSLLIKSSWVYFFGFLIGSGTSLDRRIAMIICFVSPPHFVWLSIGHHNPESTITVFCLSFH